MKKVNLEDSPDDANQVPSRTGLRPRAGLRPRTGLRSQQTGTSSSAECKDDSDDEYVECKKESGEDSEEYDDDWSAYEDGTRRSDHRTVQATRFIPYTSSILTFHRRPLGTLTTSAPQLSVPRTLPTTVRPMAELVAGAHARLTMRNGTRATMGT